MRIPTFVIFLLSILLTLNHSVLAGFFDNQVQVADSLFQAKNYDSAIVIAQHTLNSSIQEYGQDAFQTLTVRYTLAQYYNERGDLDKVVRLCLQNVEILKQQASPDTSFLYDNLINLGDVLGLQHRAEASNNYLFEASRLINSIPDYTQKMLASLMYLIGYNYRVLNDFNSAEEYYDKVVEIIDKCQDFPVTLQVNSYYDLIGLKQNLAKYTDAEQLANKLISFCKTHLDDDDPMINVSISALGMIYEQQAKYVLAEQTFKDATYEAEIHLGKNHIEYGRALNNLAESYMIQMKYDFAESYYLKALPLYEKNKENDYNAYAFELFFMGRLYTLMGRYDEAEAFLNKCLHIRNSILPRNSIQFGHTFYRFGILYYLQGKFDQAEIYLKKSLKIRENILGPYHPNVFQTYQLLGQLYSINGREEEAIQNYHLAINYQKKFMEYSFSTASENQKMRWVKKYPPLDNSLLSFANEKQDYQTIKEAYDMTLYSKSMVIDALMAEAEITFCSNDQNLQDIYNERNKVRTKIANILVGGKFTSGNENQLTEIKQLTSLQDSLESKLSYTCSIFQDDIERKNLDFEKVMKNIPDSTVFWDFIRYTPFNFSTRELETGQERYLVFLLKKSAPLRLIDLGNAAHIDSLISSLLNEIGNAQSYMYMNKLENSETIIKKISHNLYQQIFDPLLKYSGNTCNINLCPDGMINLLPFNILTDNNNSYIIDTYKICYLTSARDLMSYHDNSPRTNTALIFADPEFDYLPVNIKNPVNVKMKQNYPDSLAYGKFRGVSTCLKEEFSHLRYSRFEATIIAEMLRQDKSLNILEFYGVDASETNIKNTSLPPLLLHIATHGFYCDSTDDNEFENPLLRSCLALAGANKVINGQSNSLTEAEDGILTAYEVSGLNLIGTELVTLSACETGLGDLRYRHNVQSEGVFGLRRAFRHAGARSIVMSLWKTSDKLTADFMESFYKYWLSGSKKSSAMRHAMLDLKDEAENQYHSSHPLLWGGFILTGKSN